MSNSLSKFYHDQAKSGLTADPSVAGYSDLSPSVKERVSSGAIDRPVRRPKRKSRRPKTSPSKKKRKTSLKRRGLKKKTGPKKTGRKKTVHRKKKSVTYF